MKYYIQKLKEAEQNLQDSNDILLLFYLNYHVLNYYNILGLFKFAIDYLNEIIEKWDTHYEFLNLMQRFVLINDIAYSYFGCRNYHKALYWLNKIRQDTSINTKSESKIFYELFYIIIHFELKNYDLVKSLILSVIRLLNQTSLKNSFQDLLSYYLKEIINFEECGEKQKAKKSLILLRKKIIQKQKTDRDVLANNTFNYFDYISWLESKIENKPFAEVVREKAKRYA